MFRSLIISGLFIFFTGCSIIPEKKATSNLDNSPGVISKIQKNIIYNTAKTFPNSTQLSLAFIVNDSVTFYGVIRENDTISYIDNKKNVFEIGSITKVFTSTLLADLVVESKICLDDKINNYLPFKLKNDVLISFKELSNHTSGFPRRPSNIKFSALKNLLNPFKNYTEDKLKKYLTKRMELNSEPGINYEYSNLGVGLLGYTISKIEKTSYPELLERKIFSVYNMHSSTTDKTEVEEKLVRGLGPFGHQVPNWDLASLEGAGAILSSAEDLAKFVMAQFDSTNAVLVLTKEKTFSIYKNSAIGLGWHINESDDRTLYWHNGGTGGYRSCIAVDVEHKLGVVVLSNASVGNRKNKLIDSLCFELL